MVDLLMKTLDSGKVDVRHLQRKNICKEKTGGASSTVKCGQCNETFRTLFARKKHEKFYHFFSKPFICECGQQFGKLCEVNYHIRRAHNKEKNYICNICKKAFFKNSDLVIHQNIHEPSAKFICEDCGRRFKHVSNLIRHSRTHTGIKPYLCLPCNKRFSQVAALRRHETTGKHKENVAEGNEQRDGVVKANEEVRVFLKKGKFGKEAENGRTCKTDAKKRKWWFYCKICGERFPFSVLLRDHETKHMANKDIKCNSCKAEFSIIRDFNNHACSHSPNENIKKKARNEDGIPDNKGSRTVVEKVPKTSREAGDSEKNLEDKEKKVELTLTHNGQIMLDNDEVLLTLNNKLYGLLLINNDVTIVENDEYLQILNTGKDQELFEGDPNLTEIFSIENCQGDFSQREAEGMAVLTDGWLWGENTLVPEEISIEKTAFASVHGNSKTLRNCICTEGRQSFDKKKKHVQHLDTHDLKAKKHKCPECKKNFSWNSSLRNHVLKNHTKRKEYSCPRCDKIYYSSILVNHHFKRDHLKIRSYKCGVCDKAFFRRYDLKVHTRIHTDERPYICGVCGKRFRHLSHSIRHDRIHMKNEMR